MEGQWEPPCWRGQHTEEFQSNKCRFEVGEGGRGLVSGEGGGGLIKKGGKIVHFVLKGLWDIKVQYTNTDHMHNNMI